MALLWASPCGALPLNGGYLQLRGLVLQGNARAVSSLILPLIDTVPSHWFQV